MPGGMRRFACLLTLTALLAPAAPARADHQRWPGSDEEEVVAGPPSPGEEWGDSEEWDTGAGAGTGADAGAIEQDQPFPDEDPVVEPEPERAVPPVLVVKGKTVRGRQAMLRADGRAAIPRGAPKRVRAIISAANEIAGKPYKWGGGHARLMDSGYDCSGAVGYSLIRGAGLMSSPMVSGAMVRWGAAGPGRWISVYANKGHVYMEIAGLRFDTSPVGDPTRRNGVRWRPVIGRRVGFHARHPIGL